MTGEQINEMRATMNRVGYVYVAQNGKLKFEGVEKGQIHQTEAFAMLELTWKNMGKLLDEVACLAEDHARMTHTLQVINEKTVYAMQGTSKSQIAADWWQAMAD